VIQPAATSGRPSWSRARRRLCPNVPKVRLITHRRSWTVKPCVRDRAPTTAIRTCVAWATRGPAKPASVQHRARKGQSRRETRSTTAPSCVLCRSAGATAARSKRPSVSTSAVRLRPTARLAGSLGSGFAGPRTGSAARTGHPGAACFGGLAVEHAPRWLRCAADPFAVGHDQRGAQPIPGTVRQQAAKPPVNGPPGRDPKGRAANCPTGRRGQAQPARRT
jgi:hypothetical protein